LLFIFNKLAPNAQKAKSKILGNKGNILRKKMPLVSKMMGLYIFGIQAEALANGDRVEIRGFCTIYVKNYKGYTGRNPKTGEPKRVPPKKLPFFKCGKELKDRVDYE
jgi:nucleoid DNA-binding protein